MQKIVDKVKCAVSRMIAPGDKVLVAVSGGADSVTLFHLLESMQEESGFDLAIAHLNHMARGRESEADAEFVSRLGKKFGIQTFLGEIDVGKERSKFKTSFQETARILRYRFLESALKKMGGNKIALGHTADDQVETVLMNLLRGSGLKGLAGIPEERGPFIRPLRECFREEVEEFLKSRGLEFRTDESNLKTHYLRNRIRLELIPSLQDYNPRFKSRIIETSKLISEEDAFLAQWMGDCFKQMAQPLKDAAGWALDVRQFNGTPLAIQRRLVREAIRLVRGNLRRISTRHVQEVISLFADPRPGKQIHLPDGLMAVCGREFIEFRGIPDRRSCIINRGSKERHPTELKIPGCTEIGEAGIRFNAKVLSDCTGFRSKHPREAYLDFAKTGEFIQARFFREGDRFVPLGMQGRKKLKSFFIDKKIPREARKFIPILTTGADDIIWVFGQRIAEPYRVTPQTRNVLFIEGLSDFRAENEESPGSL